MFGRRNRGLRIVYPLFRRFSNRFGRGRTYLLVIVLTLIPVSFAVLDSDDIHGADDLRYMCALSSGNVDGQADSEASAGDDLEAGDDSKGEVTDEP